MRRFLSVSILILSLAMVSSAPAEDWFRLNISPTIFLGSGDQEEGPPTGGEPDLPPDQSENSGGQPIITASGGFFRALAPISIPVLVGNGSGAYVLYDDHPDLEIVPGVVDGEFTLEGALMSSATVRLNATDKLYIPAEPVDLFLNVHEPLVAHGPTSLDTVRTGTPVAFDLDTDGAIGTISWDLFDAPGLVVGTNGHVTGTPSVGNHSISARATDAFDGAQDRTDPIQLHVAPNLSVTHSNISTGKDQQFSILPSVGGKIGDLAWTLASGSTELPPTVTLDPQTGRIHGQVATSTSGLQVSATDSFDGQNASTGIFSITVVADTTPDPFTVTSLTNLEPRWPVTSAPVTVTGFDEAVSITPSTGTLVSVNAGPWLSSASISPGQSFRLQTIAPDQGQNLVSNVTVGSLAPVSWSVTSWTETVRTISASTTAANPQTLFGGVWTNSSVRKRLVINSGVTVSSTESTSPALAINSSLAGSLIIENNGIVAGAGGNGGVSGNPTGTNGGTGLSLAVSGVKLINNGVIAGGGGGGGLGGRGANGSYTSTLREPSTGESYVMTTHNWFISSNGTGLISWNTTGMTASVPSASTTSVTQGSYTYYRGSLRVDDTFNKNKRYAVYRTSTQTQSITGGTGGAGGKGATYPASHTNGSSGASSPGNGSGAGGRGGNGGTYGQAGAPGNTGNTGTNGSPTAGSAGGAAGYAITGSPASGSILGTRFGS